MKLDALAQQLFPGIVASSIAVAAYYQASGLSALLGDAIDPDGPSPVQAEPVRAASSPPWERATSAEAILSRNPFDSVTGPLNGDSRAIPDAPPDESSDDPYDAPFCEGTRVRIIMAADNPDWSIAAIEPTKGEAVLRRRGSEVAGKVVEYIAWDRVWLNGGGELCQMEIGSDENRAAPKAKVASKPRPSRQRRGALPDDIASKIQRVSETELNVDRSAVDMILEQQATLLRGARITPVQKGGQLVGVRLNRVRTGTLLDTLGLKNGDTLRSINGFELTDPQKALEAYARLRAANRLSLAVERGGKPMTIDVNIR